VTSPDQTSHAAASAHAVATVATASGVDEAADRTPTATKATCTTAHTASVRGAVNRRSWSWSYR
jgi:hypothetical protein